MSDKPTYDDATDEQRRIIDELFLEWEALGLIEDTGKVKVTPAGREMIVWRKVADREDITREDPPWE